MGFFGGDYNLSIAFGSFGQNISLFFCKIMYSIGRQLIKRRFLMINPRTDMYASPVSDATPAVFFQYGSKQTQTSLARVKYNKLIDNIVGNVTTQSCDFLSDKSAKDVLGSSNDIYSGYDDLGRKFVVILILDTAKKIIKDIIADVRATLPNVTVRFVVLIYIDPESLALIEVCQDGVDLLVLRERKYRFLNMIKVHDKKPFELFLIPTVI